MSSAKLQQALAFHRQGQFGPARLMYEQILSLQPRNFDALHLLGVIAAQHNDPTRALAYIDKALEVDCTKALAHFNRGSALQDLRRWDESLESYDRAIALRADFADAHANRGIVLTELRQWRRALDSYDAAIAMRPDHAQSRCGRGHVLKQLNCLAAALADFERAIAVKPGLAEAHLGRGGILRQQNRPAEAIASFDRALEIKSDLAVAHSARGTALKDLNRWNEALSSYNRALDLAPDNAEALSNRGDLLRETNQFEAALASCDRAIALAPGYAEAHSNRGNSLLALGQVSSALASYEKAMALNEDFILPRLNRAMALLMSGNFEDGWREYEWRWKKQADEHAGHEFGQPPWLGTESLAGKTILLHGEQGLGDVIQFCRYVTRCARLGARVILRVPEPLSRLMRELPGVSSLAIPGDPLPPFDFHCPLMSLPLAFQTTLNDIPASIPYLDVDQELRARWSCKLGPGSRARVGLVWSGGFRPAQPELSGVHGRRNIPLAQLAPLRNENLEFYSLQKGQPAESELAHLNAQNWNGPVLLDFTDELNDFAETAALIEQLDLVISVDTSTAHLAGALGKPVWLLNRFDTCWRWLLERADSPWYPSMRLYRQGRPGDWAGVVQRVAADLQRWQRVAK